MMGTHPCAGLLEWERPVATAVVPLLSVFQKVPHLAHMCADAHILQELWSICREARSHVNGLVTGLKVDCADAVGGLQDSSLLSVLSGSHLQRMCVVLHLENHGEQWNW